MRFAAQKGGAGGRTGEENKMKMNKIINAPEEMVGQMLEGYLYMHGDLFERVPGTLCGMVKRNPRKKVGILIGGGAGNEPWCLGYVGKGLADALAGGHVYTAPPAKSILDVSRHMYHEEGILYIGTNHAGDRLNFELVGELALLEGIRTRCIFVNDDIASAPQNPSERRGIAGIALAVKMAGAASELGLDLEGVAGIAKKAVRNIRTLGVTSSPGYMPASGKPMCEMEEGYIEYGMGFNGEPGIKRERLKTAREIVSYMLFLLLEDIEYRKGEELALLLNGFGFTSVLELCIVVGEIAKYAEENGVRIAHIDMMNAFCPQGTGGFSISLMRLDEDLRPYYNYGADSPLYQRKALGREE